MDHVDQILLQAKDDIVIAICQHEKMHTDFFYICFYFAFYYYFFPLIYFYELLSEHFKKIFTFYLF